MARGYGLGQSGGGGLHVRSPGDYPVDDPGDHREPGKIGGAVAHEPHRGHRGGHPSLVAAHGDRVEGDVDVDGGQPAGHSQPRHRRRGLTHRLATGQEHLSDTHAQVQHVQHPGLRWHVRPDGSQQVSGRRPAAEQVARLTAQRVAEPAGEARHL
jgi:hypothetical protein